jgi:transcriptional regulator with XRE-family HTH domain
MAHPAYLREKARSLRIERQLTIDELAARLALSRSTIYHWVRDLPIARAGRANAGQRRGNRAMQRKYRLLREAAYQEGLDSFSELAIEPGFRDFVCM